MQEKKYSSIQKKLAVLLSLCMAVPMLFYCFYSYRHTRADLGEKYQAQTMDMLNATAQTISSYIQIADYTAKGLHFNTPVLTLLSRKGQMLSPSEQLKITDQLFTYMQQVYSSVPDASQVHVDAYNLRRTLLLTNDFRQYEKEHIYVKSERTAKCPPYETYITPTHLQYDYNFTNKELKNYKLVISLNLPVYLSPSVDELIARLSIDIPVEVIGRMCASLYTDQEEVYIVDSAQRVIFSSEEEMIGLNMEEREIISLTAEAEEAKTSVIRSQAKDFLFCIPMEEGPLDWYIVKVTPKSYVYHDADLFFRDSLLILLVSVVLAIALSCITIIRQTRPLKQLTGYTDSIQNGNLDDHMSDYVVYTENDEIGRLITSIRKMMYTINHFIIREYQMELANKSSELKALQAQINPHFIYNTLQCIASEAIESQNVAMYHSITTLGQMMQYSMDTKQSVVPLRCEITNSKNYVRLQKMRFSNTQIELVDQTGEDTLEFIVPKMILQPLVENAFKHGGLLKIQEARIVISSWCEDNFFHITVEDNGVGISFARLDEVNERLKRTKADLKNRGSQKFIEYFNRAEAEKEWESGRNGGKDSRLSPKQSEKPLRCEGQDLSEKMKADRSNLHSSDSIGLCNVYMRLLLTYDNQCSLSITPNEDSGTTIHIEIMMDMMGV